MDRIRQLFLLVAFLAPLHMLEQLAFGLGELEQLKTGLAAYYSLFADASRASVVLAALVGGGLMLLAYGLLAGGVPRLLATGVFALMAIAEGHHIVTAFVRASYDPGVITSVPLVTLGLLLLVAIRAEFRRAQLTWANVTPIYETW
jgi:hypothetical protein